MPALDVVLGLWRVFHHRNIMGKVMYSERGQMVPSYSLQKQCGLLIKLNPHIALAVIMSVMVEIRMTKSSDLSKFAKQSNSRLVTQGAIPFGGIGRSKFHDQAAKIGGIAFGFISLQLAYSIAFTRE